MITGESYSLCTNHATGSSQKLSQPHGFLNDDRSDEYEIYGLITIGIAWLPGLFYALVLGRCVSLSFGKRIWISILAFALAPFVPIILGFIVAVNIIPEKYSSEKVKHLFILCALLEGAMESSVQINLQGYIMNKEQEYLKVGFFL